MEIKTVNIQYIENGQDPVNYTEATELPEGRSGKCYLVKKEIRTMVKEGNQTTTVVEVPKQVIKACTKDNSTEWIDAIKVHYVNPLDGFVTVEGMGKAKIESVTDYGKYPSGNEAIRMAYGGSDLWVVLCNYLEITKGTIDENVVKAFKYKVIYTVIDTLIKAHEKDLPHEDLNPANIVCGFDTGDVGKTGADGKVITLENCLIENPILLCDRETGAVNDSDESLANSSFGRRAPGLLNHFVNNELTHKDKDVYAVLGLYALLTVGRKRMSPGTVTLTKQLLELDIYDPSTGGYNLPTLEDVMKKVKKKIDETNYFIIDERKTAQDKSYPIVYRPLDRFLEWRTQLPEMT
ncbi:MAG: hypothetical protein AABY26_00625, partial [Nanoarchaeota archaeon]